MRNYKNKVDYFIIPTKEKNKESKAKKERNKHRTVP